jgi:hypothetical protein
LGKGDNRLCQQPIYLFAQVRFRRDTLTAFDALSVTLVRGAPPFSAGTLEEWVMFAEQLFS